MILARVLTAYYFAFFLVVLPLLGLFEKTEAAAELDFGVGAARRPPRRVSAAALRRKA